MSGIKLNKRILIPYFSAVDIGEIVPDIGEVVRMLVHIGSRPEASRLGLETAKMNTTPIAYPEMVPLPKAPAIFGLSRSALYRLAAAGRVRMLKVGSRTLVDAHSVREFLATLPCVQLRQDPHRTINASVRNLKIK